MIQLTCCLPLNGEVRDLHGVAGAHEALLTHRVLSRIGADDDAALLEKREAARAAGLRVVLLWDLLLDDATLASCAARLRALDPAAFDAIRVQDPGAAAYLAEHLPHVPFQLVVETGNHNLPALQGWAHAFGEQLERLALSNEIPLDQAAAMREALPCALEMQVLGRILLLYTPRGLLSADDPERDEHDLIQRYISSDEGAGHKHFPVLENEHGTFMYYEKELFLLPYLDKLRAAGIDHARLDTRFYDRAIWPALGDALVANDAESRDVAYRRVKSFMAPRLTRGFFKSNRTDKQIKRLKNPHIAHKGPGRLGEVVEVKKDCYLALLTHKSLARGQALRIQTPDGHAVEHRVKWLRDSAGATHERGEAGFWLINHVGKVSPRSQVYDGEG